MKFNFFIKKLKYIPLSSKFLNVSNEAADGLNNISILFLLKFPYRMSLIISFKTSLIFLNTLYFILFLN